MITLSDINTAYRNGTPAERREFLELILPDINENHYFQTLFDAHLATSELKPIKRIATVETVLGLNDFADFEEDEQHEPNIPEKIQQIEEKLNNIDYRPTIRLDRELEPSTKTEERASLLVDELKTSGKNHFTSHEIISFLKSRLPESCRIEDKVQNIHKVKRDVLRKATSMYSDVFLSKKSTGHREVRLILNS
jgi:hypothetical protein